MNLIEKIKRWWAPGEYDEERPPSDGEGFALPDGDYEQLADPPSDPLVRPVVPRE
jgi:hypothetical protein